MPSKHLKSWRQRGRAKATPAELAELRAQEAAKRRRQRWRHIFAREYGRLPEGADDEKDLARLMRGHPWGCLCIDCQFGPDAEDYSRPVSRTFVG
jgi:hypothetical protein